MDKICRSVNCFLRMKIPLNLTTSLTKFSTFGCFVLGSITTLAGNNLTAKTIAGGSSYRGSATDNTVTILELLILQATRSFGEVIL